jgi:hypothetical protein
MDLILGYLGVIARTALDVFPIVAFLIVFQVWIVRQPLPHPGRMLAGVGFVILGLGLFLIGLDQALFPLGRLMATQLTDPSFIGIELTPGSTPNWRDYYWVYAFAFAIGFSTTIAEPALLAVALKAHEVSGGAVGAFGLRVAVALGVAIGVCLGCLRIVLGTPLQYYIMIGYAVVVVQTMLSPKMIIPLAYDSGGVTTSTVTVPLVTALGLGLASTIPGRSPLIDGFGLVAFASLFPIMAVLGYAQAAEWRARASRARNRRATQQLK